MYTNILFLSALLSVICLIAGDESVPIIAAWTKRITKVENGVVTSIISSTHHSVALDVNIRTREIFWSDGFFQKIYKASFIKGDSTKEVLVENVHTVDGLAIDWTTDILYWSDTGKDTIEVIKLDRKPYLHAVIVYTNLTEPRAIALHPYERLMFWTDWGIFPKIEKAYLDGSNRHSIITTNIVWPNGLTLDFDQNKLFWIDGKLERIESCNYDGSGRKLITTNLNQGFGITLFGPYLYYTNWIDRTIEKINKEDGSGSTTLQTAVNYLGEKPMALQVLNAQRQPQRESVQRNDCSTSPCSQLCLHNQFNYTCLCSLGYTIQSDGHTCKENEFLLTAWRTHISQIYLSLPTTSSVIRKESASIIAIDFLHSKGLIFWSNIIDKTISQGTLTNMENKKVIVSDTGTVDGLAVDWVCNNLYWTDTERNTIEVQSLETGARKILYTGDLDEPRAIVIYPPEAIMFFTDWGSEPKIESAALDGSERHTLVKSDLKWPNGLTIDWNSQRLYWIDGSHAYISSCNFDGSLKRIVTRLPSIHQAFGIAMNDHNIFYSEWKTNTIYKIDRQSLSIGQEIQSGITDPMGIKIYNSTQQPMLEKNPCAESSCSHICLPTKEGKSVCACPEKLSLSFDKKGCLKEDINDIEEIEIRNFKLSNIGPTSVDMAWQVSSNHSLLYFIEFKCLKMIRCQSDCDENADSEYYTFITNLTVDHLTAGAIYNVSVFNFGKLLYTDAFSTLDTNEKAPAFLKEVDVLNSTSATISWQAVHDCVPVLYYFHLFKAHDNSTVGGGTTNSTSVTLVTLEPDTEYMARVRTHINGIQSANYLTLKFTTNSAPAGQGIEELTVYKHTRKEIGLRWKIVKYLLPVNTSLKLNFKEDNKEPNELNIQPSVCDAWPDLYCYTLKNLTARKNYTISITPIFPTKIGIPVVTSAITKEAAPGIPSYLTVTTTSLSGISLRWGIPESLNGYLRSFLINIEEVDKFLEEYCCQNFPVMEVEVTSEKPSYENEIAGLQPASSYEISISAKTLYFGPSQILTLNTKPPSMKVLRVPRITLVTWLPQDMHDVWKGVEEFHPLIAGYVLMAVCVDKNHTDSGISESKLNSELVELLGPNIFLVAQYTEDEEAIDLMSDRDIECKWGEARTSLFTKGNKYKLAAIQIAQYNDAYRLDMVLSPEFVL